MKKLRKALVIFNPTKPFARKLAEKVKRFIRSRGAEVVSNPKLADALIMVSGDGTILYNKDRYDLPIFAIGSRNSVICQSSTENWEKRLGRIIDSGFSTESRSMLTCEAGGKPIKDALNEIVIRSRDHRVIDIHLSIGGKRHEFYADGVLFTTPTGSTAYCYSCGGSILPKHSRKYEIVGIAPYMRAFKPTTVRDSAVTMASTPSRTADLVFDGQFIHHIKPNAKIRIRKSRRAVRLVMV